MFDPFVPQAFNVDLDAPEAADEQTRGALLVPPVLYQPPVIVSSQPDAQLYPLRRHGVLPDRRTR